MRQTLRPLDFLGRIKVKLGMVILLAVAAAFVVNEVGINAGYSRNVRVAVAVVLALIMVQLLARGMTKPLREMAAAAQTIAKGRYGLRVTATSRDEVGELARAFNAMAADLGEVDRQRRELVANVSHELRTPITALRAVLENVVDGVSAPDQATLETALAQTERLGRLVAQLLDLSRLESGARLIELEDVGLGPLCDQALREAVLVRDGITARCEVPAGLSVRADPDLLAQVLANLLDNAVRHSPDGGVVVLTADAEGDGVRLRVTDQGPGIPPEDRARAFERFSRLDAGRAADDGGAGLGLAITKEIVELHGGSIHVEEGTGCRVAVGLPGRTTMDDSPDSDLSRPSPLPGLRPPSSPERPVPPTSEVPPSARSGLPGSSSVPVAATPEVPPPSVRSGLPGHSPVPVTAASATPEAAGPVPPPSGESLPDPRGVPVPVTPETPETPVMSEAARSAPVPAPGPGLPAAGPAPVPAPGPGLPVAGPAPVPAPGPGLPAARSAPVPAPGPGLPAPRPAPVRNWGAAFLGVILGGILGLVCAVLPVIVVGVLAPLLGALVGVLITAAGAFVGTVIGATSAPGSSDAWIGHGAPAHPSVPQGLPPGRPAVPKPEDGPRPQGGGLPPGEYVAPPLFPRPELPPTARWVLPACAAAGLLAALALPDSAMGLGSVLVAVAMGAVALPAVRKRITPWSATLGAIAYGLVAVAVFRDADWLVGLLLLAGFLLAALALSGAGRGWLGVA
ncbi:sensor histidine kinase, partial [Streptosporangium minutum]